MMKRDEKIDQYQTYIKNAIGENAYETIFIYRRNSRSMSLSLQLEIVLLKRLDYEDERRIDLSAFTDQDIIILKQMIIISIISKLQNLIESSIVLIASLSNGYSTVNRNMTYYNYDLINT